MYSYSLQHGTFLPSIFVLYFYFLFSVSFSSFSYWLRSRVYFRKIINCYPNQTGRSLDDEIVIKLFYYVLSISINSFSFFCHLLMAAFALQRSFTKMFRSMHILIVDNADLMTTDRTVIHETRINKRSSSSFVDFLYNIMWCFVPQKTAMRGCWRANAPCSWLTMFCTTCNKNMDTT